MDKFNKELKAAKNPWIKRIGNYLLSRDDIQKNLNKKNKSLDECFNYVLNEISKKCVKNGNVGYAAGDDQELFDLAVHYYDEDDIKVSKPKFRTNANGSATKKDLESIGNHKKALKEDKKIIEKSPIPKKKVAKKQKINENQMSLDDFLNFGG